MSIRIRDLKRKDCGKVIDFAIEGMNFGEYLDNRILLRLYGRYFLYLELKRATQVIAAYEGESLVGVIMADMCNEPKKYKSPFRNAYVGVMNFFIKMFFGKGASLYDKANKLMLKRFMKAHSPKGEICFLAADPKVQGKGVGSMLLGELEKRESGKLIYLYTDNNCNYRFYEKKGFALSESEEIQMKLSGKEIPLTCLLFSKTL